MSVANTMFKIALLPEILKAAQLLEKHRLLLDDETASSVVMRYVKANPDINAALNKGK